MPVSTGADMVLIQNAVQSTVITVLGGLGLFLLGMHIMTEGLQSMAGGGMQRWLARVTRTPLSGALTGMVVTAVIRSSGATTVAAVGFVGAGLLTFEQSLGVIFGANIGTTLTGWIVAYFGFKIHLGAVSQVLVLIGALFALLGRGAWSKSGRVLAGFALLFIGLDLLKDGLAGAADGISLVQFQTRSVGGRLLLVVFGALFTLLTQSSSATVATALAAMGAGIIDLPQSLAIVIGADIGTTATAWLATVGGTTDSRRTGLSHVVYNILTGMFAFLLLPLYHEFALRAWPGLDTTGEQFATVAFHSLFNILGVVVILPFTRYFARLICWMVPEHSPSPGSALDARLLETPAAAIETLHHATAGTAVLALACMEAALGRPPAVTPAERLDFIERSARKCRGFVGELVSSAGEARLRLRLPEILHTLDHIDRMVDRCRDAENIQRLANIPALAEEVGQVLDACKSLRLALSAKRETTACEARLEAIAAHLESDHAATRHQFIQSAVRGERAPEELDRDLNAHRWLRRSAWHAYRICHYLGAGSVAGHDGGFQPPSPSSGWRIEDHGSRVSGCN